MKSFQNFADNLVEAEAKQKTKVNVIAPEILPMQPEGETASPKTKTVKQSEVSADIKSKSVEKKKAEAIKKGYVSPEGRVQERGVITNRIRAAALGYGDKGKDPTKYGINPAEVSKNKTTLFQRALSSSRPERRSARREIKKAVRSIETRYPGSTERTATSFRGFSRGVGYTPSKSDISTLQRMARPETTSQAAARLASQLGTGSGKRAQAASDAAKDIAAEPKRQAQQAVKRSSKKAAGFADLQKAIDDTGSSRPRKKIVTKQSKPAPVAPKSQNINLGDTSLPKTSKAPKVSPLSVSAPAPRMTPDSVGKAFDQVLQNREARKAAEKAKGALKFAKAVKGAGTALSIVGSGIEAKGGYETARREGASQRRALGAGAARGLGSFIGGGVGAAAGSVLGLPGAIAGGAAGYGLGANVGTAAYKAVTGDIKKKLTTQGLKTNIRKAVPYEIRKQVPAGARKAFGDFITQAGKQYGKWQKSQQQQGGNK